MSGDKSKSSDSELWEACRAAVRMQALNLDFDEPFDETLDKSLRNALQRMTFVLGSKRPNRQRPRRQQQRRRRHMMAARA
jgi:hypothetical protein